jgi:hypothetical protein
MVVMGTKKIKTVPNKCLCRSKPCILKAHSKSGGSIGASLECQCCF